MKKVIINYESYEKNIFNGSPIYIYQAYFSEFKFIENEKIFFINYQLLTEDNKLINFVSNFTTDDIDEKTLLETQYGHLKGTGISNSHLVPNLMSVSSFYVENINDSDYYSIYCNLLLNGSKESTVYKLIFNKSSFMSVMIIYNQIKNYEDINYNMTNYSNLISNDTKTKKINYDYKYIIRNMYVEIPKKMPIIGKDKVNIICLISVTLKDSKDNHFRLFYKIYIPYKDFKIVKPSRYTTNMDEFLKFDKVLEKENTYINSIIGDVDIHISRKSDYPIIKKLLYTIPYENDSITPVYVEFTTAAFDNFKEAIYNYIFK